MNGTESSVKRVQAEESGPNDVGILPVKERKAIYRRLREACLVKVLAMNKPKSLDKFSRACSISDFALSIGLDLSYSLIEDLLEGKHLRFNDRTIYAILTGELRTVEVGSKDVQIRQLHTILKKK
ncbi:TPA: hypothetical protein ACTW52_003670 [Klebsiella quasipneumoniae subsp. similipneumoniae]|nr:hypothetical protein [Klebsiella quasipneumoniae]MEB5576907.1 hypothetical protein [Klebsiella quasipneumoniae]MEB5743210.1 hypothetical protein [Klebsiella quasipneumoniae]HDT1622489.1 hypothetical protein [Klebsiella quasipneumoniae subsp. similipneumoniae]